MKRRVHALRRRYGHAGGPLQAVVKATGKAVKPGAAVVDFRGDKWKLVRPTRANEGGRDGKVLVRAVRVGELLSSGWEQEFYAGVFDLAVEES
jgi:hypothetical protein